MWFIFNLCCLARSDVKTVSPFIDWLLQQSFTHLACRLVYVVFVYQILNGSPVAGLKFKSCAKIAYSFLWWAKQAVFSFRQRTILGLWTDQNVRKRSIAIALSFDQCLIWPNLFCKALMIFLFLHIFFILCSKLFSLWY